MNPAGDIGIVTTDADLVIQTWDEWLAYATSISADRVKGRPLLHLVPPGEAEGLLARAGETLASGTVHVLSPAFHRPLIPCPPRAASKHYELMQQRVTIGPLLDGERVAGLVVTIQDVTPRLETERDLAAALLSENAETRRAAADAVAAAPRIEALAHFTPALGSDDWRVRRTAVRGLAGAADRDLLHALIGTLRREHRDFSTLSSALKLFAVTDVDVTGPLADLLKDDDRDLRIQAALALGEQHHPAAVGPLIEALGDPDANVRFHAIEALGRLHAAAAVDALVAIVESRDFFLAFAALEALAAINDPRAAFRLVPLLADDTLGDAVAGALREIGDEDVVAPLVDLLDRSPERACAVAGALASIADRLVHFTGDDARVADVVRGRLSAAGRDGVLAAVTTAPAESRPALARVLAWIGDDAALGAAMTLARDPGARTAALEALVRQAERGAGLIAALLTAEDLELRVQAIEALGRIGSPATVPSLLAQLEAGPPVAIAAAGALARTGDARAIEPLLALAGHADPAVRQSVVAALLALGTNRISQQIIDMLGHQDSRVRESAVRLAAVLGTDEAKALVLPLTSDPDENVRVAAVEHLPAFDDSRVVPLLAEALANGTPGTRAAAARALARVDPPGATPLLVGALADADAWVRYFAARSLGSLPDGADRPALAGLVETDPSIPVRIAAIDSIGTRGVKVATEALLRCAAHPDPEVSAAALRTLGRVGGDEALDPLRSAVRDDNAVRRRAAIDGLTANGRAEAVALVQWLAATDPDPQTASHAMAALVRLASLNGAAADAAVDSLVALFADRDRCPAAADAACHLPLERMPRVAHGLAHADPAVRRRTVDVLARVRQPSATRLLSPAFGDDDAGVRETAVLAVLRLGTRQFDDTLRLLGQDDPSKAVRRAAAAALAAGRRLA